MSDLLEKMSDYRRTDSWAVWETDSDGALTGRMPFPLSQAPSVAQSRTMLVALNPGGTAEDAANREDWGNFHSADAKHNDVFLASALLGTPFWGGYIADLLPDVHESDSGKVSLTNVLKRQAVETLVEKALLLGASSVVCLGGKSAEAVHRFSSLLEEGAGIDPGSVYSIWHYSRSNGGLHKQDASIYRDHVHRALGLA